MYLRQLIILTLCSLLYCPADARTKVPASEQDAMVRKMEQTAEGTATLQCSFYQTKQLSLLNEKMRSKGLMYFEKHNKLRWEYTSPYTYTFIFNGSHVMFKSSQKKDVIDIQSSHLFQEIANIIMTSVTGQLLSSKENFNVTMFRETDGSVWIARLVPLKKQMKQMFRDISLHINPQQGVVTQVEIDERSGDITVIQLTNIKINAPIDEQVFCFD